ncbi:hypothetical protein [Paenibacillus contaminans]|uniref:Uncharacterized protein n=1 Tax=Paenibacillus contaminans TaxID=450362 RepID=A0A329MQ05_9BACL|nr:hypothetical protein [Paenibacillus contaminans]RAV21366.1 hypothetical protein DQG23_11980 [Paenibacillus contaminans]
MKTFVYPFYALILGVVAFFTGEIVTFIMLGFILLALTNIVTVLREISRKLDQKNKDTRSGP